MTDNFLIWDETESFMSAEERNTNRILAEHLCDLGYEAIIENYTYIDSAEITQFFDLIPFSDDIFKGIGVDLGGGAAVISSSIARHYNVERMYCVEGVASVAKLLQPIVKSTILSGDSSKVVSVIGSYDDLDIPENSIDFAVAWDSLHHSTDPARTLAECLRVLKPGGRLVLVDRAHDNSTPDSEIERMLNIVYGPEFIKSSYRAAGTILTRFENGEREYRYREWEKFFRQAGLKTESAIEILGGQSDHDFAPNDASIQQLHFDHHVGGFLNRKIVYTLSKPPDN
jgi:ubiquinone/menaquinone biosynthesis C-methylase UbiE